MKKKLKKYFVGGDEDISTPINPKKNAWENPFQFRKAPNTVPPGMESTLVNIAAQQNAQNFAQQDKQNSLPNGIVTPAGTTNFGQLQAPQDPLGKMVNGQEMQQVVPNERKTTYGVGDLHPMFQALNLGAMAVTGIANTINGGKSAREERRKLTELIQNPEYANNPVINDIPMYEKGGDAMKKRRAAGFKILRDGEVNGKKLSPAQKKFFAAMAFSKGKKKAKYGIDLEVEGDVMGKLSDRAPLHEQGGVNINDQVEAEQGEVFTTENGQVSKVLENTSTKRKDTLSRSLKVTPEMFKEMFGGTIKNPVSHADALDEADKYYEKKAKRLMNKLNKGAEILEKNPSDFYAANSLELNMRTTDALPTRNDLFDVLFSHQEEVKNMMSFIEQPKAKYGGKYNIPKALFGMDEQPIDPHLTDNIPTIDPKTGKKSKNWNGSKYDKATWEAIKEKLGYKGKDDNKEFQKFLQAKYPDLVAEAHSKKSGWGIPKGGILDGKLGVRWDAIAEKALEKEAPAPQTTVSRIDPGPLPNMKPTVAEPKSTVVNPTPTVAPLQKPEAIQPSKYHMPLGYEQLAGDFMAYATSDRIPAQYNGAEANEFDIKLFNPEPQLEAGQRDFNAALSTLPEGGAGMANATNLLSSKYSIDNQVLANAENLNNATTNAYNQTIAGIRDRQAGINQGARAAFSREQLGGIEAQRQQRLKSLDGVMGKIAQHKAFLANANMRMIPNKQYDQFGRYNGNAATFSGPTGTQGSQAGLNIQYVDDPMGGRFRIMRDSDGKILSQTKIIEDKKKAGLG